MNAAIAVKALRKRYGDTVAVDGVSFSVSSGEVFALLGPNGAGKTTTVEILEGFRRPDEGDISVLGYDPARDLKRLAPRIGVMPQDGGLWAGIRPREAVRLFARLYDTSEDPDVLLERLELAELRRRTFRNLSGGERQRLSLALAVVGRPQVAFLDEPTAGIDPRGRAVVWDVIAELKQRGTTVLLTTHLLDEAERLADRVGILHHGRLVATGTPDELMAADADEIRFEH
jgi:ABC-2 type transport system ATP-binding protein